MDAPERVTVEKAVLAELKETRVEYVREGHPVELGLRGAVIESEWLPEVDGEPLPLR